MLVGHLSTCILVLSQITRVTRCEFDVTVQDIKDELAYAIHEFLVKLGIMALHSSGSAVLNT